MWLGVFAGAALKLVSWVGFTWPLAGLASDSSRTTLFCLELLLVVLRFETGDLVLAMDKKSKVVGIGSDPLPPLIALAQYFSKIISLILNLR